MRRFQRPQHRRRAHVVRTRVAEVMLVTLALCSAAVIVFLTLGGESTSSEVAEIPDGVIDSSQDATHKEGGNKEPGDGAREQASDGSFTGPWWTLGSNNAGAAGEREHSDKAIADFAGETLREYRDSRDCLLRQAGYLDLLGNVWGCVVQGGGWVDVVIVSSDPEGGSTRSVVRLNEDEFAKGFEALRD